MFHLISHLRGVNHPNIVGLFGAITTPILGLVLERLHQSLSQAVFNKERKLTLVEKIEFAKDIASGLFFLHNEKGIIHRDIKPRNILVLFIEFSINKVQDRQGLSDC